MNPKAWTVKGKGFTSQGAFFSFFLKGINRKNMICVTGDVSTDNTVSFHRLSKYTGS